MSRPVEKRGMLRAMLWHTSTFQYGLSCCFLLLLSAVSGCASNALSTEAPNVFNVTAQPSVLTTGEAIRLDFYYSEDLPIGDDDRVRQLDPNALEELGISVLGWQFESAFRFFLDIEVSEQVEPDIYSIELPITNEFEQFVVRFDLQVTR